MRPRRRCGCGRQFRIIFSVLDLGPIICGTCGQDFIGEALNDYT